MALPDSREQTLVDGISQVKAKTVNDLQDWIISLYADDRVTPVSPFEGGPLLDTITWTTVSGGIRITSGIGASWSIPIRLPAGKRVKEIALEVKDNATGPTKVSMEVRRSNGSEDVQIGSTQASDGSGNVQTLTEPTDFTIDGDSVYRVQIAVADASDDVDVYRLKVTHDRPAP